MQQANDPLEAARQALESALFRQNPNRWATGIATGAIPAAAAVEQQAAPPRQILIFVDPAIPDCEMAAIEQLAEGTNQPHQILRVGRFAGLAASGDGVGYFAPFQYNVPEISVGTLSLVTAPQKGQFVLSSNHVLAHNGRVPAGTPVVSPGLLDESSGGPLIASYTDCVRLQLPVWKTPARPGGACLQGTPANLVDCAIAAVPAGTAISATPIASVLNPVPFWTPVTKNGYGSGTQSGIASIMSCGTFIDFTFATCWFQGMIGVFSPAGSNPPFGVPGDSGCIACTPAGEGVGLVTARAYVVDPGGQLQGYIVLMCPLAAVQTALAQLGLGAAAQLQFSR